MSEKKLKEILEELLKELENLPVNYFEGAGFSEEKKDRALIKRFEVKNLIRKKLEELR